MGVARAIAKREAARSGGHRSARPTYGYLRLTGRGKARVRALIACARKRLVFANTVVTRGTPSKDKSQLIGCCGSSKLIVYKPMELILSPPCLTLSIEVRQYEQAAYADTPIY
jgi:hypothetical protein